MTDTCFSCRQQSSGSWPSWQHRGCLPNFALTWSVSRREPAADSIKNQLRALKDPVKTSDFLHELGGPVMYALMSVSFNSLAFHGMDKAASAVLHRWLGSLNDCRSIVLAWLACGSL